jgi:NADPH-dependent 2,4-dienoyl-CoA reductase/sulfur reductase-like enzyme
MGTPRVAIVGAGPAGVRAAERLVSASFRPILIDEAPRSGGQIYRRQPANFTRTYRQLYGFDAGKARALHQAFDRISAAIDYRPDTAVWNIFGNKLYTVSDGRADEVEFDSVILATGATDRVAPVKGWTLPGCYTLGGAQIALKAQACSIGRRVIFLGTGPLLYLVAFQYASAGVDVRAVLDSSPLSAQVAAAAAMAARPSLLARGLYFRAHLMARGIAVHNGVMPVEIHGPGRVTGVRVRLGDGTTVDIQADAVAMGYHLRSESQLADLAGCNFTFDERSGQWAPQCDDAGRTDRAGIYVAGDGAKILGADAAETGGRLAALSVMKAAGMAIPEKEAAVLRRRLAAFERFRRGLLTGFPWPQAMIRSVPDDVLLCRCEAISAGELRHAAREQGAPELNRAKAFSRVGMGRCQGRYCGCAAAEILAGSLGVPVAAVGRIRAQAPVKPLSVAVVSTSLS